MSDDSAEDSYELRTTSAVRRTLSETLPEAAAAAAYEFITGPLLTDPHRIGKRLLPPMDDRFSARRGTHRVIYRIDDDAECVRWLRYPGPPDRRRRIEVFCDAYGMPVPEDASACVAEVQRMVAANCEADARHGIEPQATWSVRATSANARHGSHGPSQAASDVRQIVLLVSGGNLGLQDGRRHLVEIVGRLR